MANDRRLITRKDIVLNSDGGDKPPVATLYGEETWERGKLKLHYYYDKTKRLKEAPSNVKEYYEGRGPKFDRGLFGWLTATRSNKFLLFALVIMLGVSGGVSFFSKKDDSAQLSGVEYNLSALRNEDSVYIKLSYKSARGNGASNSNANLKEDFSVSYYSVNKDKARMKEGEGSIFFDGSNGNLTTILRDYDIIYIITEVKDLKTRKSIKLKASVR